MKKLLIFLASLLPLIILLLGPIDSDWFMNRHGFFGAWVVLPTILAVAVFVQAGIYYRYIFSSTGVLFRAGASLLLGICGVLLAAGLWIAFHSVVPYPHHGI